jgi:outer membrane protein OmpA-like peptidoglycan-associated protein
MKKFMFILIAGGLLFSNAGPAAAQIKDPVKQADKEGEQRVNKGIDKTIDKGFNKIEEGIGSLLKKKKKPEKSEPAKQTPVVKPADNPQPSAQQQSGPALKWAKYDFVPGDKIIFEDNLLNEENGEFPSRWDLVNGTVENAEFGGENVIMFRGGDPTIVPYLKNPEKDYLPEVFTIEFDLYLPNNTFTIYFFDRKNQTRPAGETYLNITSTTMELNPARSDLPNNGSISNKWAHISVAYTSGKFKAYIDDTRLINIPHLKFNPFGISLNAYHANDNRRYYVKNFRLAEGGVKYYDKFLQDGKIVSNGIRFDVGKASLRPESMGVLNEIYKMLSEHPDVAVSVEGHTDSDGDNGLNQKLSEDRAQTVMEQLVSMGISQERLSFKGYGESKPVAPNDTPEGKASNRRVEFLKK